MATSEASGDNPKPNLTRTEAEEKLEKYLLGLLTPTQEDGVVNALYEFEDLYLRLEDQEELLMQQHLDGALDLARYPALGRRWTRDESKAKLSFLKSVRTLQSQSVAPVPSKVVQMPQRAVPAWVWGSAMAAGLAIAVLGINWMVQRQTIQQLTAQLEEKRLQPPLIKDPAPNPVPPIINAQETINKRPPREKGGGQAAGGGLQTVPHSAGPADSFDTNSDKPVYWAALEGDVPTNARVRATLQWRPEGDPEMLAVTEIQNNRYRFVVKP